MTTVFHRSLIRHSERGISITLPRAWLDAHGLKPRDKVEVIAGELIIRPVPNGGTSTLLRSLISKPPKGVRITLPAWWLRLWGLKRGDRVEVIDNGDLIVRPLPRGGQGPGERA